MTKKACGILLGAVILLAGLWMNTKHVLADAIAAPRDDFSVSRHEELIWSRYQKYTTNGPDGKVIVYRSPEDASIVTQLENGEVFWSGYAYEDKDGIFWVIYENEESDITGWVPHDYLTVEYNLISFLKEFSDEFIEEEGEPDSSLAGTEAYYWDYPGSNVGYKSVYPAVSGWNEVYVDELGRKWGCETIIRKWICLDAPGADFVTLYPDGAPEWGTGQAEKSTADPGQIIPAGMGWHQMAIVGVLIAVVMGITWMLLRRLKKSES